MQARLNQNLLEAIERIEKARIAVDRRRIVQLVAVSKYSTQEEIATLYACGQRAFGENKVQDLQQKASALEALPLEWHFIGSLQSNKINALLQLKPYLLQSLHSLELAQALQSRLERENQQLNALLQVNSAKEISKSGFMPEDALEAYARIKEECKNIKLCGLMSIGAHTEDKAVVQKALNLHKIFFHKSKTQKCLVWE